MSDIEFSGPGFYKMVDGELTTAPNFVDAPTYSLHVQEKDKYTYPVDGWIWASSYQEAKDLFDNKYNKTISPLQARLVLIQMGLMPQVKAIIAAADEVTQEAWEFATEFKRSSPLLLGLASTLGLSSSQLDEMFASASKIEV